MGVVSRHGDSAVRVSGCRAARAGGGLEKSLRELHKLGKLREPRGPRGRRRYGSGFAERLAGQFGGTYTTKSTRILIGAFASMLVLVSCGGDSGSSDPEFPIRDSDIIRSSIVNDSIRSRSPRLINGGRFYEATNQPNGRVSYEKVEGTPEVTEDVHYDMYITRNSEVLYVLAETGSKFEYGIFFDDVIASPPVDLSGLVSYSGATTYTFTNDYETITDEFSMDIRFDLAGDTVTNFRIGGLLDKDLDVSLTAFRQFGQTFRGIQYGDDIVIDELEIKGDLYSRNAENVAGLIEGKWLSTSSSSLPEEPNLIGVFAGER